MRFIRRRDTRPGSPLAEAVDPPASVRPANAPLSSGAVPDFIVGGDAYYWHKRHGPDPRWADFSSRDPEYEWAVGMVADVQGVRFRRCYISTRVGHVPPPTVHCFDIGNDPVAELPTFRSTFWPSLAAALDHAGVSRTEDSVLVQVFVDYVERTA